MRISAGTVVIPIENPSKKAKLHLMPDQEKKRVVVTGMSVLTTLGDTLESLHAALLQGKSGIARWKNPLYADSVSRIGGDLSDYDIDRKRMHLRDRIPETVFRQVTRLLVNTPRPTAVSMLLGIEAFADAGLFLNGTDPAGMSAILAGPYQSELYKLANWQAFGSDPDAIEPSMALREMDTDTLGCLMEALGMKGAGFSTGGSCGAGNIALRTAMDDIRHHGTPVSLVLSPMHELTPASLFSLARLGALSLDKFDNEPARASRPFDVERNGFVPAAGSAALVLEELGHARFRNARIYAEISGVGINTNGSRGPSPVVERIAEVMELALDEAGVDRRAIDYLSAHATSTWSGDIAEARAIQQVFGSRTRDLKVNALKSMLGHQIAASALVELVAAILQMQAGVLYPTINIDHLDPEIDLDVCPNHPIHFQVNCLMKNAFGFGGVNTACILKKYSG